MTMITVAVGPTACPRALPRTPQRHRRRAAQLGLSLVEVAIVAAIVVLVAIIGIPAVGGFVIEHKVPKVAEAVQRFAMRTQVNAQGGGGTPYLGLDNGVLARALQDNTVFDVRGGGAGATVAHGLGQGGSVNLAAGGGGAAFTITLTKVNHAACPALASILQSTAGVVRLAAPGGGAVLVKDAWASPAVPYSAARTARACGQGDVNSFVFEYR